MAQIPNKQTRRWIDYKFRYTADDGTDRITSDRIALDTAGEPVIPITLMLQQRQVTDSKTKLWGAVENLRKVEIRYEEPRNATGEATTRRYVPYQPLNGCREYIEELRETINNKFNLSDTAWCASYSGETRFTVVRPNGNEDI